MKKIIAILLISMFSFSTVTYAGSQEVIEEFTDFLEQKQEPAPVKKVNDGNFDWLWDFLRGKKDSIKQERQEQLNRANEALKDLHKFEPRKFQK